MGRGMQCSAKQRSKWKKKYWYGTSPSLSILFSPSSPITIPSPLSCPHTLPSSPPLSSPLLPSPFPPFPTIQLSGDRCELPSSSGVPGRQRVCVTECDEAIWWPFGNIKFTVPLWINQNVTRMQAWLPDPATTTVLLQAFWVHRPAQQSH